MNEFIKVRDDELLVSPKFAGFAVVCVVTSFVVLMRLSEKKKDHY